eukprot:3298936-Karenia_brevis.AAC.1
MATIKTRFTMSNVAAVPKRPAESAPVEEKTTKRIPKACEVTIMAEAPKQTLKTTQRLPNWAPVIITVYKVTDEAADVWNVFENTQSVSLWQAQIKHDARPSLTYGILDSFNEFLRQASTDNESIPTTLAELQQKAGIKLVLTDNKDPEEIGFVNWRVAFYVAGMDDALNNFFYLLDDFFVFKHKALGKEKPFEVHIFPHEGEEITCQDMQYQHYTFNEPKLILPLGIFEAQTVTNKRIVQLHLQPENEQTLSVVITGNTWSFRARLDSHGIPGAYFGDEKDRKYVRILKSVDVADEVQKQRVLDMFGEKVFRNLALRVILDSDPSPDTAVSSFVDELREIPSIHFAETKC